MKQTYERKNGIWPRISAVENTRSEKGRMTMYEASEIVAIGAAHEMILGVKPPSQTTDNETIPFSANRLQDIDETDE
jgi:hypothetical protein